MIKRNLLLRIGVLSLITGVVEAQVTKLESDDLYICGEPSLYTEEATGDVKMFIETREMRSYISDRGIAVMARKNSLGNYDILLMNRKEVKAQDVRGQESVGYAPKQLQITDSNGVYCRATVPNQIRTTFTCAATYDQMGQPLLEIEYIDDGTTDRLEKENDTQYDLHRMRITYYPPDAASVKKLEAFTSSENYVKRRIKSKAPGKPSRLGYVFQAGNQPLDCRFFTQENLNDLLKFEGFIK